MYETDQVSPNDIAIVGMALRVPGARNVREFWENLRGGVESIRDLTEDELLAAGESAARMHLPNYVRRTSELPGMEMFDADFFGLSPKEAAIMDPQHRHFLECAWEAMEDAGRTPDSSAGPVGVFAGCGMGSYFYFNVCSNRQLVDQVGMFLLRHTGNDKDFLATRASFAFDLRGPSVNIQTACSTSLVAIHTACQSLLAGECEMALAGGVTIELPHRRGYLFQDGEILSTDGHCRAFDHRADGTVFGSGAGVVVLRRLSDAIADGDIIHAVIKATAVNNDGNSKAGYLAPSVTGQAEAIIEAQGLAGVSADEIQYVECHGTGTYLGDPIEIEALTQAFRQSTARTGFCRVGSVKSNIGHLDTAAGVVSLIKTTLALKHGEMPPTLNFEKPNPAIDFARSPFVVNDKLTPWPAVSGPRRAAVNSLGVGGTNAHAILEAAPKSIAAAARGDSEPQLFLFATKNRKALDRAMDQIGEEITRRPALPLTDVSHTLFTGRKHFEHRRAVAARGRDEAVALLSGSEPRRVHTHSTIEAANAVFLFPGGGAQHVGMTRSLYAEDAGFRATVDEGLNYLTPEAATEIRRVWLAADTDPSRAASDFLRPSVQLPAILIVEIATARMWMRWGVKPSALIGHSMGENAAACIAGVMSFRDVVNLVRLRGELFDTVEAGGMLSVPLSPEALSEHMNPALDLASVNAPELCVVSGRNEDLEALGLRLAERGIDASRIAIDIAAHSQMLDPILGRFEAFLHSIDLRAPSIPIVSNLTGEWLSDAQARDPLYWVRHLRSTVHFAKGLAAVSAQPGRVYIEVGPSRALSSLVKLQPGVEANQVINSLPHPDEATDDRVHFLAALGRAWATGLDVSIAKLWEGSGARRVSLPTYPFQHQRYFIERSVAAVTNENEQDFIGKLPDMTDWGFQPSWKQALADVTIDADARPESWLVFMDDTGLGTALVERLRAKDHRVATVKAGDSFVRHDSGNYTLCAEQERPGYDALFSGLAGDGGIPERIVHLWLTTGEETFRPGSNFFNRNQERGFQSLFFIAQALGDIEGFEPQITVVTNGMQRVGAEPLPYPEKATIVGPALVMPKEMAGATVRLVDLEHSAPSRPGTSGFMRTRKPAGDLDTALQGQQLDQLWDDIFAAPASETVAHRKGKRWIRSYKKLALAEANADSALLRKGGVYLITGGLGDLAQVVAGELASRFQAKLVLAGRLELPPREKWATLTLPLSRNDRTRRAIEAIQALEAKGAEVLYVTADVGNLEDMTAVADQARAAFGGINGVFHAAGLVDDNLIQLKSLEEMETVLSPKLRGTVVLDEVFRDRPLDLFVLFSSTSTDTAPAGQVDYVAANAYLNAYADSRFGDGSRKTVALHWGVWNAVGLAARATGQAGQADAPSPHRGKAQGPFFTDWVEDAQGDVWLEARISPRSHWMLDEHRLVSGQAILPGTGTIEIIAQAMKEYGIDQGSDIADLFFLRPLEVDDGRDKILRVRLANDGDRQHALVTAADAELMSEGFTVHAEASLRKRLAKPHAAADVAAASARLIAGQRAEGKAALPSVQEDHIRFGPRWKVLRSLARGDREALAELRLDEAYRGDIAGFIAHPALLDIATGFALDLAPGHATSHALWAPMSYGSIAFYMRLPEAIVSWARLSEASDLGDGFATFDITIATPDGNIVAEIERFVMKRLDDDLALASAQRVDRARKPAGDDKEPLSPAALQLAAQVSQGILPAEGFDAMLRALATGQPQPIVSSMDLGALRKRAAQPRAEVQGSGEVFERPDLDNDYVAPRDEIERTLAGFWSELLGVEKIGVHDSFFDIGGHSLIAVRLFRMIRKQFALDLPISVLFEAPTIAECAALIGKQVTPMDAGTTGSATSDNDTARIEKATHLVTMSAGRASGATPFFLCAGMFGNVLNLRQLAMQLGTDRPVYGLQARGLYGDQEPHDNFVEMARDNLREVRAIQPHGPYLLGGFSGGGLVAYEMALQLRDEGEEVAQLILLDTPLPTQPPLSVLDRFSMKLQDLRRERHNFIANWIDNRRRWKEKVAGRADAEDAEQASEQFHNLAIENAFRAALPRYELKPYAGSVLLLRPKLNVIYRLSGGRMLQDGRNVAMEDNGWTPFAADLTVQEVPGDHDSMVLEPFVRILADRIRKRLKEPARAYGMAAE
ncbi:beta-ketoacyl synthase N-terminal-like domain-containing protein [Aminobacter aganoensis]|uniref:Phenolphthiocerol/phthiocerol polyketide synthase subunit E n=1 Tax=Aminobacter aganoensis TaxID=83264 RepID=A0A7X0FB74_9HYPH|nr:type I polyketide synthase [Aminobacter aganoensis]MBB6356514.1 acyl transferase domain-containing protein/thioesterase domain-containing protein [Aminobacter aganoensis]